MIINYKLIFALIVVYIIVFVGGLYFINSDYYEERTSQVDYDNDNMVVFINSDINEVLVNQYINFDTEFIYCVYGTQNENDTYITKIQMAEIYESSPIHVQFNEECPKNPKGTILLGTIHNHKGGLCKLSRADVYTFGFRHSKDKIMGVICGVDEYGFFTPGYLDKSHEVRIIN